MKKQICLVTAAALLITGLAGCAGTQGDAGDLAGPTADGVSYADAQVITLSGDSAALDGVAVEKFDYTWHCDPSVSHDEVKNAPAEYYTGTAPETNAPVYIDHELYYFPELEESGFTLENYDGEREWVYRYTDGEHDEYIFATLPMLGSGLPTQMMHSAEEAAAEQVLHITAPGTYVLEGAWNGQVWVDLGDEDETFADPEAKVTLVLNGAEIDCAVAPGLVFRSAYECDNSWEEQEAWSVEVDTTDAGVQVVLADGTENSVSGANIYRMLKTVYKDENSTEAVKVQKKLRKIDAAFYSYVSMNVSGGGALTVTSGFEGMDSELHLSINGGDITIHSQDDGMNVNEDNVSVISFNGGAVTINAGLGAEGDGVDSNGYIALRGGTVRINGVTPPDSAMDSEDGIYYESGELYIDDVLQEYSAGDMFRETGGMGGFGGKGEMPGMGGMGDRPGMFAQEDFDLAQFQADVAALEEDATLEDVLALLGMGGFGGMGGGWPDMGQIPEGVPQG